MNKDRKANKIICTLCYRDMKIGYERTNFGEWSAEQRTNDREWTVNDLAHSKMKIMFGAVFYQGISEQEIKDSLLNRYKATWKDWGLEGSIGDLEATFLTTELLNDGTKILGRFRSTFKQSGEDLNEDEIKNYLYESFMKSLSNGDKKKNPNK